MDFTPLPIALGTPIYHANQFRTHLRAPRLSGAFDKRVTTLADDFQAHFCDYFNGEQKPMKLNIGNVHIDATKSFNGHAGLRFVIDTNLKWLLGDIHSDWVAIIKQQKQNAGRKLVKGFAAQTLRREFGEPVDDKIRTLGRVVSGGGYITTALIGALPVSPFMDVTVKYGVEYVIDLNKNHFLAGRRSWVVGLVDTTVSEPKLAASKKKARTTVTGQKTTYVADPIFFLETAAVERYSHAAFQLAEGGPGLLVNMRKAINTVWLTQLGNFLSKESRVPVIATPESFKSLGALWINGGGGVYYRRDKYETQAQCLNTDWIKDDLLPRHEGLAEQF